MLPFSDSLLHAPKVPGRPTWKGEVSKCGRSGRINPHRGADMKHPGLAGLRGPGQEGKGCLLQDWPRSLKGLGLPQIEPVGTRACGRYGEGWREAGKGDLCIWSQRQKEEGPVEDSQPAWETGLRDK